MPHKSLEDRRIYQAGWWKRNQAKHLGYVKRHKQNCRQWFEYLRSKLSCERCAESHPACLDFHHRDPDEKDFNISVMVMSGLSKENIEHEMSKCIVLCSNCHRKLHWGEKKITGNSNHMKFVTTTPTHQAANQGGDM